MVESPFKPEILRGKVALLTGGGSGIGYEISLQLGKHGASIAIMGRRKHVVDSAVSSLNSLGIPVSLSDDIICLTIWVIFILFHFRVCGDFLNSWICLVAEKAQERSREFQLLLFIF
jgi:hypothetical protein